MNHNNNPSLPLSDRFSESESMNSKISQGRTVNGTTTWVKDKTSRVEHITRQQAGHLVFFSPTGKRLGYIDSLGRTLSANNHLLNSQPRPDLILNQESA